MPGGNGKGPAGAGPMTGRAERFCAGNGAPGRSRRTGCCGWVRGGGCGGFGRGFGNRFFATGLPGWARFCGPVVGDAAESPSIASESEALHMQLDGIKRRLDQLEKEQG